MKVTNKSCVLFLAFIFFFAPILLAQVPANDNCGSALKITPDSTCVNGTSRLTGQTLTNATNQAYTLNSTCGMLATARDVWYYFVARTKYPAITISNVGAGWGGIGNVRIQLFSGICGVATFTEVACGTGPTLIPALTNPLIEGNIYYIRIHKNSSAAIAANHTFDICVTDELSRGSRMNEIFSRTILSAAGVLNYPWEIAYGRDNNLWITESKGYKVYRMDPNTGVKTTVLDISQSSTFLPVADRTFNCQFANGSGAQGGLAGLVLHPNFMDGTAQEKNYVYISYIFSSDGGASPSGQFYTNRLARFTYNVITNKLELPVLIATLPGSSDHNSQRVTIAPVAIGGSKYLFYAAGDMGGGQFGNRTRPNNAQNPAILEGKILRYNLDTVGGVPWIPTTNPYSTTSPVWSIGIRNNQGFAYDTTLNILYGISHGPYSDDELNIIQPFKNYGHPLVIGYADGNYNADTTVANTRVSAGAPYTDANGVSSCPPISNEVNRMNTINANALVSGGYKGPLYSAYATPRATIQNTWTSNPGNAGWYSEAWSGLDLYQNKIIPGWKQSLVAAGLKWGRLIRLKLSTNGTKTLPSNLDSANTADTITYLQSTNRYRDLAFAPNGKDIFLVMDNNSATSGPGVGNPTVPACPGCVLKYSFLGYAADASGFSTIAKTVRVADGTNTCNAGTQVTIDGTNNFLWVPITGPDGNIMAEINAMGQNLGLITSSFYKHIGALRTNNGTRYLNRNITITPAVTSFAIPVKVRLYISKAEFDALAADPLSSIGSILQLKVLKNNDPCVSSIASSTIILTPANNLVPDLTQDTSGYVLQVNVSSFSSFYFGASNITLPVSLLTFTGSLQNNSVTQLNWKTTNEINTAYFNVERSTDGQIFNQIGTVAASGNTSTETNYNYKDVDVADLASQYVFYRLKMFDINGTFKYSNIIRVTLPGTKGIVTLSPNPAISDIKASIISADECNAEWQVIDVAGRILLQGNTSLKKGSNELMINLNKLAAGSYYLKVKGSCIDLKSKFQKL